MTKVFFNPQPKPVKTDKKKKKYHYNRKPTGELELFLEIIRDRGRMSFITPDNMIVHPKPENFIHVLAKGKNKYPLFKKYKKNIVIGTFDEHHAWDNGSMTDLANPCWEKMFLLEDELKKEYKKLLDKLKISKYAKINPSDYQEVIDNVEKYLE